MFIIQRNIQQYITDNGKCPYREWFLSLDEKIKNRIRSRLTRVEVGHFGDWSSVGEGVFELRFHFGPGYRIYFGQVGMTIVLLLCGGDKKTQSPDIRKAQEYWADYRRRSHESE